MEEFFIKLLNMSITASYFILAVIALRPLLKKAPKNLRCILWMLVGVRLICPFSVQSAISLIPSAQTIPEDFLISQTPAINSGLPAVNQAVNPIIGQAFAPNLGDSANPLQVLAFAASAIWLAGMFAMLIYALVSCLRLHNKTKEAVKLSNHVLICDHIATPFVFGIFRPQIYLPSSITETDVQYVLFHEKAHLKRRDHLWKPLGFVLLAVYWFNPLLWLAYSLFCKDMELACDEHVLREHGAEIKKPYSNALINCSAPRRAAAACPLAFGETGVKSRVKNVLRYKKPAVWIAAAAVVVCAVTAMCFITNPREKNYMPDIFDEKSPHVYLYDSCWVQAPKLHLNQSNHAFKLAWSPLVNYPSFEGKYNLSNDILTCHIDDGKYILTFKYDQPSKKLFFDASRSITPPSLYVLLDAVSLPFSRYYDCIEIDIDGDGKTEICTLSCLGNIYYPVFYFCISKDNTVLSYDYYLHYSFKNYTLSFTTDADGKIKITGTDHNGKQIIIDMEITNGKVVLSENGKLLNRWQTNS